MSYPSRLRAEAGHGGGSIVRQRGRLAVVYCGSGWRQGRGGVVVRRYEACGGQVCCRCARELCEKCLLGLVQGLEGLLLLRDLSNVGFQLQALLECLVGKGLVRLHVKGRVRCAQGRRLYECRGRGFWLGIESDVTEEGEGGGPESKARCKQADGGRGAKNGR